MLRACLLFLLLTSAATQADACQIASLETTRLARPAAGAMSVRYGVRRHPILQVAKLHTGLDFKAQLGDPIQAVAAGRVVTWNVRASTATSSPSTTATASRPGTRI
jgi:murein DD-endopeptidase MepM/ murein hydrolase activator NlpD